MTSDVWHFLKPWAARLFNGDWFDIIQAESDGERQAEISDAVSALLRPVSSWSVPWLNNSDALTKYYRYNYRTACVHSYACGLSEEVIYYLFIFLAVIKTSQVVLDGST